MLTSDPRQCRCFKRPDWAKSQTSELDESESNIFSHSERSYREILADQERKKREKAQKAERKKVKEERRTSEKHKIQDESDGGSNTKRRRITLEDGEALLSSVGLSAKVAPGASDEENEVEAQPSEGVVRRSPRINKQMKRVSPRKPNKFDISAAVMDVEESDTDDVHVVRSVPAPKADVVEEESDEEFAELARQARLRRQQKELQDRNSGTPEVAGQPPSPGRGAVDTGTKQSTNSSTRPGGPAIHIFTHTKHQPTHRAS